MYLILPRRPFQAAYFSLRLVPLPAVSVHCLMYRPSPAIKRKNVFSSGRMASRDLPDSRHSLTDKCKISMIIDIYGMMIHFGPHNSYHHYTNLTFVCDVTSVTGSHSTRAKNIFFLFIAGLGRYMRQSTDIAGNGTSRSLK